MIFFSKIIEEYGVNDHGTKNNWFDQVNFLQQSSHGVLKWIWKLKNIRKLKYFWKLKKSNIPLSQSFNHILTPFFHSIHFIFNSTASNLYLIFPWHFQFVLFLSLFFYINLFQTNLLICKETTHQSLMLFSISFCERSERNVFSNVKKMRMKSHLDIIFAHCYIVFSPLLWQFTYGTAFASRKKNQKRRDLFLFVYKQVEFTSSFIIITQNHIKRQSRTWMRWYFTITLLPSKAQRRKRRRIKEPFSHKIISLPLCVSLHTNVNVCFCDTFWWLPKWYYREDFHPSPCATICCSLVFSRGRQQFLSLI